MKRKVDTKASKGRKLRCEGGRKGRGEGEVGVCGRGGRRYVGCVCRFYPRRKGILMTNIFLCCPHLLRYQVHQKLVGFMAPLEREGLTDTAK